MYLPSDEPDSVRIARNREQARWILPCLSLLTGLIVVFAADASKDWRNHGFVFLAIGATGLVGECLEQWTASRKAKIWFDVTAFALYIIVLLYRLL